MIARPVIDATHEVYGLSLFHFEQAVAHELMPEVAAGFVDFLNWVRQAQQAQPGYEGYRMERGTREYYIMLATPRLKAVAHLLHEKRQDRPSKVISAITIWLTIPENPQSYDIDIRVDFIDSPRSTPQDVAMS